ncbi:hypothetical protein D3C72_1673420 [compost metagenome]
MQAASHHFLARARIAIDQHIGRFVSYVEYQAPYVAHRHGITQEARFDAAAVLELAAQAVHFQGQAPGFQRAQDDVDQLVGRIRFFDEIIGARAHGMHGHGDVAMACNEDHGQVGIERLDRLQQFQAAHAGQAHVAHDDAGEIGRQQFIGQLGRVKGQHVQAGQLQCLLAAFAYGGVVFDQQDLQAVKHVFPPALQSVVRW